MYIKILLLCLLQLSITGCSKESARNTSPQTEPAGNYSAPEKVPSDSLDFESVIKDFKSKLDDSFTIEQDSYFVIASNLDESETKKIIHNTINPAVVCFYNDFFQKKPDDVTTILLFKNDVTYRSWAKKLYNDDDLSRFGYYKPDYKVMLMNISTGTGTLVHELTHALVRYDFPDIPSWFNEGLGSLYERCSLQNGVILGYVNWRLPELQDAVKDNTYTSLDKLTGLNDEQFYGDRSSYYYAQARYFCMFLQEKNMLKKFYKTFRDNFNEDTTGKKFILSVTGEDMSRIEKEFVTWVSGLSEQ